LSGDINGGQLGHDRAQVLTEPLGDYALRYYITSIAAQCEWDAFDMTVAAVAHAAVALAHGPRPNAAGLNSLLHSCFASQSRMAQGALRICGAKFKSAAESSSSSRPGVLIGGQASRRRPGRE